MRYEFAIAREFARIRIHSRAIERECRFSAAAKARTRNELAVC